MRVKYIGPFPEVEIFETGEWVEHGKTVTVDAALAGRPPKGDPTDPETYDPGDGLLAQPSNWVPVKAPAKADKATHEDKSNAPEAAPGAEITDGGEGK